jgi:hypothetical protein
MAALQLGEEIREIHGEALPWFDMHIFATGAAFAQPRASRGFSGTGRRSASDLVSYRVSAKTFRIRLR